MSQIIPTSFLVPITAKRSWQQSFTWDCIQRKDFRTCWVRYDIAFVVHDHVYLMLLTELEKTCIRGIQTLLSCMLGSLGHPQEEDRGFCSSWPSCFAIPSRFAALAP